MITLDIVNIANIY